MLFSDILIGTILGAILWPIVQQVVDSTNRAILGFIIGGFVGGALAWARIGLLVGRIMGASLGANIEPIELDLGLAFVDAMFQTARGGAIGAIIILSLRSISFVLAGAGIGLLIGLFLSGGLRLLNQTLLTEPLSDLQITAVVFLGTFLIFGLLSSRK